MADTGNHAIRKFSVGGNITTIAGNGSAGFTGDGGQAASSQLNAPGGLAFDKTGNLYVADSGNNRVRVINTATGVISTVAGNGVKWVCR